MIDRLIPIPTREEAWDMLNEWVKSPSLIRHSLAVEAVMRKYAYEYHQDPLKWAVTGLVHDFDYERHPAPGPDGHPFVGSLYLESLGWPAEMREAILAHASYTGVPRASLLAKVLFAVDELTGFICASALTQPERSLDTLEVRTVMNQLKDRSFNRAFSREDLNIAVDALHLELDQHVAFCIEAMKPVQRRIGLGAPLPRLVK